MEKKLNRPLLRMAEVGKDLTSRVSTATSTTKVGQEQKSLPREYSVEGTLCAKTNQHMNELLNECTEQNLLEQNDDVCREHQWKLNLFCMEPDCEMSICVQCLYDGHKSHEFGNIEEVMPERCEALLTDVQSLKEKIQRSKDKLITVQNKENASISACIDTIRKNEEELIRKIKKQTEKIVQTVLGQKVQVYKSFNEAVAKIQDNFVLLESIEETTSEYTSHKSLTDKIKAVKKSGEQVQIALTEVQKYRCITYEECKVPNRKVKALCGRLRGRRRKIPLLKIKEANTNTLKQRLLAKRESGNTPAEFCEQSRGNEEESKKLQVDVIDGDKLSKRKTVVKPKFAPPRKLRDTPDKDNANGSRSKDFSERNSSDKFNKNETQCMDVGNFFGAQNSEVNAPTSKQFAEQRESKPNVRPKRMPTVIDFHGINGHKTPDARYLLKRPDTPTDRSFTTGPNQPDQRSLARWNGTPGSRLVTRWGGISDNRWPSTRGPINYNCPPWEATDRGYYGPTAKRARHDIRAFPSAMLKVKYTGGKMIYSWFSFIVSTF